MKPEKAQGEQFIAALTGSAKTPVTFQTLTDDAVQRSQIKALKKPDPLARVLHGSLDQHFPELCDWSERRAGIFMMINEGDLLGRKTENVKRIRAFFGESDSGGLQTDPPIQISMSVLSKAGPHFYFILKEPSTQLDLFGPIQQAIAEKLGTDPTIFDLPRVMRLPGFPHQKDISNPFFVQINRINDALHG